MNEINPYAPPEADLAPPLENDLSAPLASRWSRLGAELVDGVIVQTVVIPIRIFAGAYEISSREGSYAMYSMSDTPLWIATGMVIWVLLNWTFLQNGQTIGKRLMKLQIQRKDGSKISAARILTHRALPVYLARFIPLLAGIFAFFDAVMIFREDRNTLHDDIADTKVVKLPG